ncbi:MAG: hypothetical protein WD556_01435 [Actinomycetota bacterium]
MVGIEVRRSQRPLWAAVSALLATGMLLSLVLASSARQSAEASAAASAQRAVQEVLAPALSSSDVAQPVTARRAAELGALVTERLLSAGPSDALAIYRRDGTVVFDTDRANIGSREPNERGRIARVAEQGRESVVDHSAFRVFVPLRLEADGPILGVVEVTRPYEPLWAGASRPWRIGTIVLAALLLASLALLALTFRDGFGRGRRRVLRPNPSASTPEPAPAPEPSLVRIAEPAAPGAKQGPEETRQDPAYLHPDFRQAVEARRLADERAARAERLAEETNRRLAVAQSELERIRAGSISVRDNEASGQLEALDELGDRVRLLEAERDHLTGQLQRAEQIRTELAQRAATPVADPNTTQRLAAAEERAERTEAARAELESRTIELERSLTDANDTRAELQRALARATEPSDGDSVADRLQLELDRTKDELGIARAEAADLAERLEAAERREKLQDALRHLHAGADDTANGDSPAPAAAEVGAGANEPIEDRRASAPFVQQLSTDARASVAAIQGTLIAMQHRRPEPEDTTLVEKLRTHAGKLDHLVQDLLHADDLARGDVELAYRRTELAELVGRVVEDAPFDRDQHPIEVRTQPVELGVDPLRVEEIVSALVANAVARSRPGAEILVRLERSDGGALLSVEDDEPSSDASMSPVVARFADVHGGWAIVEGRQGGGSAFRVFLPDHAADVAPDGGDDVTIMLPETSPHGLTAP